MATRPYRNPRIQFVPSDSVHGVVRELSALSGKSRSMIVSELMDEMEPVLTSQVEAFRKIAAAPEQAQALIDAYAAKSVADIGQAVMQFHSDADGRTVEGKKAKSRGVR